MIKMRSLNAAVLSMLVLSAGSVATYSRASDTAALRSLPAPLFGVTINEVSGLPQIVASSRRLSHKPTTRIYFNVNEPPGHYAGAVRTLHPYSYLMGELLDSSEEKGISTGAFEARTKSYLRAFGANIDIWEIGNEVNGRWLGSYSTVSAKLTEAYHAVAARRDRTALTLFYNAGCGDGRRELGPIPFSRKYVPAGVRDGLNYVLLSYFVYYCHGIRPSSAQWTSYFKRLHNLYPHAQLGFGEVGMQNPATKATLATARSLITY